MCVQYELWRVADPSTSLWAIVNGRALAIGSYLCGLPTIPEASFLSTSLSLFVNEKDAGPGDTIVWICTILKDALR
jgi:hypothetical protein